MWNLGPIDFEAERDGQEFQAKSGVARVVNPYSQSVKLKSKYQLASQCDSYANSDNGVSYQNIKAVVEGSAAQIIPIIFAVFINLLDACTFGTVFFPSQLGSGISGLAIELFLLSTVIVQLVLIRMSSFSCGLGTSMAENIPFVHTMATGIFESLEHTHTVHQMLPTVLVTVCLSTIINGVLFFVVGYFKMGNVLHFFPRHVIMGMTAGFGVFLMSTAVESSTGIVMASQTPQSFIEALSLSRCYQMVIVMSFEAALRLVEYLKFNDLVVPCMMFFLPIAFYIVLAASGTTFQQARGSDWLFPETASAKWWDTWMLFDFSMVEWHAVAGQWTTISSLAFFTLILVPIRIPSLSIITEDDVNFDEELKAQGIANILSGMCGAVHNYLSYSNSIFFFYVGGRGKGSQMAVTLLTLLLFFIGPQIINYVPRLIAGVIMLHLGVDLVVGALISSRKALDSLEYSSVLFIATVVSFQGFVPGIFMGVVSACVTFVVQSSRQSSIRAVFSGDTARSNTSWSSRQRDKLDVGLLGGSSILVVQLQGHLFFGNVQQVVEGIESALLLNLSAEGESALAGTASPTVHCQLRYLILDCSFVTGADVNAVTGLLKMRDQIAAKFNNTNSGYSSMNDLGITLPKKIQVRVIFAGLQNSLEAMFIIQEETLAEQQKLKATKEFEKNGVRMSFTELERSSSFYRRDRGDKIDKKHKKYERDNKNNVDHFWRDEVDDRLNGCKTARGGAGSSEEVSQVNLKAAEGTVNFKSKDAYHDDTNEMSGYDSTHSFDSFSSRSDSNNDLTSVKSAPISLPSLSSLPFPRAPSVPSTSSLSLTRRSKQDEDKTNDERRDEKREDFEKKRGRSPSWGSTQMSNMLNGGSNSNIAALQNSCLITARLSQVPDYKEFPQSAPSPTPPLLIPSPAMIAPQAMRPSPLLRLFDIETVENQSVMRADQRADQKDQKDQKVTIGAELELTVTEKTSLINASAKSPPGAPSAASGLTLLRQSVTISAPEPRGSEPSTPFRMHSHHVSNRPLSRMFYSDVNTALQAVEERIIKSTPMPK